jgi:hypothetical protein
MRAKSPVGSVISTPVTGITAAVTVTVQVAALLPSAVVTLMVAVPMATAVTVPVALTVALVASLLLHVTALLVALVGIKLQVSVWLPPTARLSVVGLRETEATGTFVVAAVTFTVQVAIFPPS